MAGADGADSVLVAPLIPSGVARIANPHARPVTPIGLTARLSASGCIQPPLGPGGATVVEPGTPGRKDVADDQRGSRLAEQTTAHLVPLSSTEKGATRRR